jgi:hypothetical protein
VVEVLEVSKNESVYLPTLAALGEIGAAEHLPMPVKASSAASVARAAAVPRKHD